MIEARGIEYLRKKLVKYQTQIDKRYRQYDMKHHDYDKGLTIPIDLRLQYRATLGWCAKSVDSLADRLVFREFSNDIFDVNSIFQMNNPDTFFDSAILSALIASCCFVYISQGEEGVPRLQIIEGAMATGVIDPITGLLNEGYAILKSSQKPEEKLEAYFLPYETHYYKGGKLTSVYKHSAPYPLLVPIIHRPDAVRPFGRSRITRSAMYYQSYAKRTLERADVTAEFYSFPQKYVVGTSQDAEPMDKWKATVTSLLEFTKDEDGDKPTLGQFTTSSMSPFTEQLRTAAAGFAGETGLTLDDLGFVSDNPSSSEAIKASHETLRVMAKKAQRNFSSGFLNVGYLSVCLRDEFAYSRNRFYLLRPKWEPVFDIDAGALTLIGDAIIKINQALPGYVTGETIRDISGLEGDENAVPITQEKNNEGDLNG